MLKKLILTGVCLFMAQQVLAKDTTELLDVRTQAEWDEKHIDGSTLIDFKKADFKEQIAKLDKEKSYQVFCRSGNRSGSALTIMKELGFKNVSNGGSVEDVLAKTKGKCVGPKCGG